MPFSSLRSSDSAGNLTIGDDRTCLRIGPEPLLLLPPLDELLHLATTVPPAVFARLSGIGIRAATRWVEHAGGNWTTYAAIRTKTTDSPRQNR